MHYIIYLCAGIGVSSLSLFSPSIVAGIGYTGLEAQLFVIPPYACAYVVTLAAAYMSDKYNCRGLVAAVFFLLGMITFLIPGESDTFYNELPRLTMSSSMRPYTIPQTPLRNACAGSMRCFWFSTLPVCLGIG